jgi:hypothetical protein
MRIVGGAMILGTLFSLGAQVPPIAQTSATVYRVGTLLPALIGFGLVLGQEFARRTMIALSVLGLAGAVALGLGTHIWIVAVILAVACGAYLMLLVGEPGGGRLILGCIILVAELAVSFFLRGGPGPAAARVLQAGDEIESEPVQRVAGSAWRFHVPPQRWYVSKRKFPDLESEGVTLERALVRPEGAATAFLFSRKIPSDRGFDLDTLSNGISKVWAKQFQSYALHDVAPLPGRGGTRVLHFSATANGEKFEALCALYPNAPMFYALMVGASPGSFPTLREELEGVLASFQSDTLPPEPTPTRTDLERMLSQPRAPAPPAPR